LNYTYNFVDDGDGSYTFYTYPYRTITDPRTGTTSTYASETIRPDQILKDISNYLYYTSGNTEKRELITTSSTSTTTSTTTTAVTTTTLSSDVWSDNKLTLLAVVSFFGLIAVVFMATLVLMMTMGESFDWSFLGIKDIGITTMIIILVLAGVLIAVGVYMYTLISVAL
jgi:hypothetical protein